MNLSTSFLQKAYWNKKRIQIVVFCFLFASFFVYFGKQFSQNYQIGINVYKDTSRSCMSERFYIYKKTLTDSERLEAIKKENILVFWSEGVTSEIYKKQIKFTKYAGAVEGDHIVIKDHKLYINNEYTSDRSIFMVNKLVQNDYEHLTLDANYYIKKGEFLPLGTNEEFSFDGRFWGAASYKNVVGVVIWKGVTWL